MDASPPPPRRRLPLFGWIVIASVVGIGVLLSIPLNYKSRMTARHETVDARLHSLDKVESAWRQNDYDRNGIADYWTRDMAGLYYVEGSEGRSVALIDLRFARADDAPALRTETMGVASVPCDGYRYQAMQVDQDGAPYLQSSAPSPKAKHAPAGVCTNGARFGFTAFPDRYGFDGALGFIVDEDGTVWHKDTGKSEPILDRKAANPESVGSDWSQY